MELMVKTVYRRDAGKRGETDVLHGCFSVNKKLCIKYTHLSRCTILPYADCDRLCMLQLCLFYRNTSLHLSLPIPDSRFIHSSYKFIYCCAILLSYQYHSTVLPTTEADSCGAIKREGLVEEGQGATVEAASTTESLLKKS